MPLAFAILAGGIMYLTLLFNFSKKIQYMLLLTGGIVASVTFAEIWRNPYTSVTGSDCGNCFPSIIDDSYCRTLGVLQKKYPKHAEDYYQCYMAAGFGCDTFFNWSIFCSGCFR